MLPAREQLRLIEAMRDKARNFTKAKVMKKRTIPLY